MIEYIQSHQPGFWIAVGFAMLAVEVLMFGFSTIVLLFAGLAAIITGLLMMSGLLPETWLAGISSVGIATGIIGALLWKPLRAMQDNIPGKPRPTSDLVGHRFVLQQAISRTEAGSHRYSGIDWKVELSADAGTDSLAAGQQVEVVSLDAGIFRVKAAD